MLAKRMSNKSCLHADPKFEKSSRAPKHPHKKSDHAFIPPDSPNSWENKDTSIRFCAECKSNYIPHIEPPNECYSTALDSPCSLQDGRSETDLLKDLCLPVCRVPLVRCDAKKSDADLRLQYGVLREGSLKLRRVKKSLINHYTRSVPSKQFKVHYGNNYVNELAALGCDNVLKGTAKEVSCGELYKKHIISGFHSLRFDQFRDLSQKTVGAVYRDRLELRHRISEFIREREDELRQKKRVYFEQDKYVLAKEEAARKLKHCKVDLGQDCKGLCEKSVRSICESISREEAKKRGKRKIFYDKNFYVFVPKGAETTCKEAVAKTKQCKVVPNTLKHSLSPGSMRKLFDAITEREEKILNCRRTSCEKDPGNISLGSKSVSCDSLDLSPMEVLLHYRTSPSTDSGNGSLGPDCITGGSCGTISGSEEADSQDRRIGGGEEAENISPSLDSMSDSISKERPSKRKQHSSTKEKGTQQIIKYSEKEFIVVNQKEIDKFEKAVNNLKHYKVVINSLQQKRKKAVNTEKNCRVVLNGLNGSLHAMLVSQKEAKNRQEKRKCRKSNTILESFEQPPHSFNVGLLSGLADSNCGKGSDIVQEGSKDELNVLVDRNCYNKFKIEVQKNSCKVALDSHIREFKENNRNTVTVDESTHQDNLHFINSNENGPNCILRRLNTERYFSNSVTDQDSLYSSCSNLSIGSRTTFSGFTSKENVLPPYTVTVDESTHQDNLHFINSNENGPNCILRPLNTQPYFSNSVTDQDSLSSSSSNLSIGSRTTFSGFTSKETSLPPHSVAVDQSAHQEIFPFINSCENGLYAISSHSNTEHKSSNSLTGQGSLSFSSSNLSIGSRTTFSGFTSKETSLSPQSVAVDQSTHQDVSPLINPNENHSNTEHNSSNCVTGQDSLSFSSSNLSIGSRTTFSGFTSKETSLSPQSVAVGQSTHQDVSPLINPNENHSNTEHNSSNCVTDQDSLSSSSSNLSIGSRTTFSGFTSKETSLSPQSVAVDQSTHQDVSPLINPNENHSNTEHNSSNCVTDQDSLSSSSSNLSIGSRITFSGILMSDLSEPESVDNESMTPESYRTYSQSTNESMFARSQGHSDYFRSVSEPMSQGLSNSTIQSSLLNNSSQMCETQKLIEKPNNKLSTVTKHSSQMCDTQKLIGKPNNKHSTVTKHSSQMCDTQKLIGKPNNKHSTVTKHSSQMCDTQKLIGKPNNKHSTVTKHSLQMCDTQKLIGKPNNKHSTVTKHSSQMCDTQKLIGKPNNKHSTVTKHSSQMCDTQKLIGKPNNKRTTVTKHSSQMCDTQKLIGKPDNKHSTVTKHSSQMCDIQKLIGKPNNKHSTITKHSSQETCVLSISSKTAPDSQELLVESQNNETLTTYNVESHDSEPFLNGNNSQELFVESQNNETLTTKNVESYNSEPFLNGNNSQELFVESQNNEPLTTNNVDSQELFGKCQNSPTSCSVSGSPKPCDSTQNSLEPTIKDHFHATKLNSPNACNTSAISNPYTPKHFDHEFTFSDALTSCIRQNSSKACSTSTLCIPHSNVQSSTLPAMDTVSGDTSTRTHTDADKNSLDFRTSSSMFQDLLDSIKKMDVTKSDDKRIKVNGVCNGLNSVDSVPSSSSSTIDDPFTVNPPPTFANIINRDW